MGQMGASDFDAIEPLAQGAQGFERRIADLIEIFE
jgi:hypothetical protein